MINNWNEFHHKKQRKQAIDETIELVETACNKKCTPQYEIQLIKSRLERLKYKNNILKKLLGRQGRNKRGLANFIGDISKTLFGTLSESDLNQINTEFDNLYKDNNNLASVLSSHAKILKLILDSSSLDHKELLNTQNQERNLARNLSIGFNTLLRESFVNTKLVLTSVLIDETNEDIDTAINSINDGKHGIIHPQILTPGMLKETIKEFETLQRTRYHFDAEEDNYQHIIDISVLSVAVIKVCLPTSWKSQ